MHHKKLYMQNTHLELSRVIKMRLFFKETANWQEVLKSEQSCHWYPLDKTGSWTIFRKISMKMQASCSINIGHRSPLCIVCDLHPPSCIAKMTCSEWQRYGKMGNDCNLLRSPTGWEMKWKRHGKLLALEELYVLVIIVQLRWFFESVCPVEGPAERNTSELEGWPIYL